MRISADICKNLYPNQRVSVLKLWKTKHKIKPEILMAWNWNVALAQKAHPKSQPNIYLKSHLKIVLVLG